MDMWIFTLMDIWIHIIFHIDVPKSNRIYMLCHSYCEVKVDVIDCGLKYF